MPMFYVILMPSETLLAKETEQKSLLKSSLALKSGEKRKKKKKMPFQEAVQAGKIVKTALNSHPECRMKVLSVLCCII